MVRSAYHLDGDTPASNRPADSRLRLSRTSRQCPRLRDLGVLLKSHMSVDARLTLLVSSCFGVLRQIRCIRRSLPREALSMLVASFVTSKNDNCNVALAGLPQHDLDRIRSALNAAARLTADPRKFDHVTPLLVNLHWLRVPERSTNFAFCSAPLSKWSSTTVSVRVDPAAVGRRLTPSLQIYNSRHSFIH